MGRRRLEEQTITGSDGTPLNVGVGGDPTRPTLLLLHGLAARWQAFSPLIPRLWEDWHLVAPDFRGHGGSGHAPGTYALTRLVADTEVVLDAIGVDGDVTVYGHSLGGWVALWMAAESPGDVRGIIVGDTAIDPSSVDPDFTVNYLSDVGIAMRSIGKSLHQVDEEVMTAFREEALTAGYDPEAVLDRVRCPVLLLQADPGSGGLMGDDDVALAHRHLDQVSHRRLDGVGHGLHIEDPHAVMNVLEPFFAALPGAP